MIFELLFWCLLGPLGIAGLGFGLAIQADGRQPALGGGRWLSNLLAVGGWIAGIFLAIVGRQGVSGWSEESWQSVIVPIAFASLLFGLCQCLSEKWLATQWWVAGMGMAWIAYIAMPTGDGWQDALPLHRLWMFLVVTAGWTNIFWLARLAASGAERWVGWIALAALGGLTMLASTIYGGLAEWCLSACAVTGLGALLSLRWPSAQLWTTIFPASQFLAAGTASCRFYNYAEVPHWAYLLVMFTPSIIALADLLSGQIWKDKTPFVRPVIAASVSACILAVIALVLLIPTE